MKKRFTFVDDGDNILLEDFGLPVPRHRMIEPEVVPVHETESEEDFFEDAIEGEASIQEEERIPDDANAIPNTSSASDDSLLQNAPLCIPDAIPNTSSASDESLLQNAPLQNAPQYRRSSRANAGKGPQRYGNCVSKY